MVTLEDILEDIVGDFSHQNLMHNTDFQPQADGSHLIDGATYIREVNKVQDWHLPSDGPKTVNDLTTEALESIPDSALCLQLGHYRLEILHASETE